MYRPQVSPDRTSPMEYRLYNPALIQSQPSPQYPSTSSHILQQPSIKTYTQQQFPYVHDTLQIQPQEQLTLSKVTSNYHEEFQSLNNAGSISVYIHYYYIKLYIIVIFK